jgi:tetratricopeptide (TPR) repeat protein
MGDGNLLPMPDELDRMSREAHTHSRQGQPNKAEKLCIELLRQNTRLKGPDDRATLLAEGNLASVFWHQCRYPEAEKIQRNLVEKFKSLFGWADADTRAAACNLVATYQQQRQLREAKALATELLGHQQENPKIRSSEALTTQLKLAHIAHIGGNFQEAAEMRRSVLDHRTELDNCDLAQALVGHAQSLMLLGNTDDSKKAFGEALNIYESSLGARHVATLACKTSLAEVCHLEGSVEDAIKLGYEVLEIQKECWGEVHPNTLGTRNNLAVYLGRASRWKESKTEIDCAVEISRSHLGDENVLTSQILSNAASLYVDMGDLSTATELADISLLQSRRNFGEDHPETLDAMFEHARCMWRKGEREGALGGMKLCVSRTKRRYGDNNRLTLFRAETLAELEKL